MSVEHLNMKFLIYMRSCWIIFLLGFRVEHAISECYNFRDCQSCRSLKGVALYCQVENMTLTELCDICEQLNDTLISLEVKNTNLTTISDGCFRKCTSLETLVLQNTSLRYLQNYSFENLKSLRNLNLDNNELIRNCEFANPSSLPYLINLEKLSLRRNIGGFYCDNGRHYLANVPTHAFQSLQEILLDGVYQVRFGSNFRHYTNLTYLGLSGHTSNCSVAYLSSKTFANLPTVTHLDLSSCNITSIDSGVFEILHELTYLNLSDNQGLGFSPLRNISYGLRATRTKVLDYSKVYKTFGIGTKLTICDVWYLKETAVEELHFESNRLETIETNALYLSPPNLRRLYAGNNRFCYGPYMLQLGCLQNLEFVELDYQHKWHDLHVYNNEIHVLEKDDVPAVKCPVPKWNRSNYNCPYFSDDRKVNYLNARYPLNVTSVSIVSSGIRYKVNFNASLTIRNKITEIDLSNNVIYFLDHFFMPLPHLKRLSLSNNFCSYISNNFFNVSENLEILVMSHNLLGSLLAKDSRGMTFKALKKLHCLDLSYNNIVTLPVNVFQSNENIETLNLSNNRLDKFNIEIHKMKKLAKIDLRNNLLESVPVKLLESIKTLSLAGKKNISIDLSNNTLSVSCENIEFLTWVTENTEFFINLNEYTFHDNGGTAVLNFDSVLALLPSLQKRCIPYGVLIAIFSLIILVFFVLVSSGILHRYRWRLKYLYYMARARYHKQDPFLERNSDLEYTYDAFISCANEDIYFVRYEILPKLEDEFGLKLCVHARDFLPGNFIAENILEAIQKSRRTVVILSAHFLKSKWCQYEFHMARMEGIHSRDKQPVLFVIIYQEVETNKLSLEMQECLSGETYVKYPTDGLERSFFWNSLYHALK